MLWSPDTYYGYMEVKESISIFISYQYLAFIRLSATSISEIG